MNSKKNTHPWCGRYHRKRISFLQVTWTIRPLPLLLLSVLLHLLPQLLQLHLTGDHLLFEASVLHRHAPQEPLQLLPPLGPVL